VFCLTRPDDTRAKNYIAQAAIAPFSYPEVHVGASRTAPPAGYTVDHNRVRLGDGDTCFDRAVYALTNWQMFDLPWLTLLGRERAPAVGVTVAVMPSHLGFYSINPCRVIYTVDETESGIRRVGFGYGTLPGHVARGEERFLIELRADGGVWYDLLAFSQPAHLFVRLGYPFARRMQRRFARGSLEAMRRAVTQPGGALIHV
jgi:uncharacterized protein (UPF0548 family)